MQTLREALDRTKSLLDQGSVPSSRRVAEEMLSSVLHISRMELYLQFDRPLANLEWRKIERVVNRHVSGEPVEYVTERVEFYGNELQVNQDVLIPRPETEILVEYICESISGKGRLLDLCCGSGCIGLGIKRAFPEMAVILSDISEQAIKVARQNALANELSVGLACGDLIEPIIGERFDFVVCNPPYISESDWHDLDHSVKAFEPKLALVGGRSGVEFYERLAEGLPLILEPNAKVFLEIGYDQEESVGAIFGASCWKRMRCVKDWSGHSRFFFLEFESNFQ